MRHIIIGTCAWGILSLMGCADDSADGKEQMRTHELRLSLGTHQYDATRALPDGFEDYNHTNAIAKIMQIQGYMAYWNVDKNPAVWDALPCTFTYTPSDADIWTSRVSLKPLSTNSQDPVDHKTYYLYGYMPKENVGSSVDIAPYGNPKSYANGAVITFTSLKTVLAGDLCAIVGVQGWDGKPSTGVPDMSSRLGQFNYYPETEGNSIFLLIDHLYAGLEFSMTLDDDYAKLRDIRLKSVSLTPEDGENSVIETVDAVVTIAANNENPMSVVFQNLKNPASSEASSTTVFYDEEGKSLSTKPAFMACACPNTNTNFTLEATYDVYDSKGNMIRKDEKAQNAILLEHNYLEAGKLHVVNIKVKPTYLYVLSDPDLDNPTFQVE